MKIYLLYFFLIISLFGCGGGGNESGYLTMPPTPVTIEFDGDSIMYGITLQTSIPTYIKSKYPDWIIDDRSVPGLTLKSLDLGYIEPYLNADPTFFPRGPQPPFSGVEHNSKIIVLELGTNDAYSYISADEFEYHLRSVLKTILDKGSVPVLVTLPTYSASYGFNSITLDLAKKYNVIIRKIAFEYFISVAELDTVPYAVSDTIDGIHRTQAASNVFAEIVLNAILLTRP